MKFKLIRLLTLVLSLMMVISLFAGCGEKKEDHQSGVTTTGKATKTPSTESSSEEPAEITVFLREFWAGIPFEGQQIVEGLQERTNTKWNIIVGAAAELDAQLNTLFAARNYPDIFCFGQDEAFLAGAIEDGILLPLDDHLDKLPNLYEKKKGVWGYLKHKDGKVYHVPAAVEPNNGVDVIMAYRKDWLDKFDFNVPVTMDEYIAVADAFSNSDPDGNGMKDTYAVCARSGNLGRFGDFIFAAYGVLPDLWITEEKGSDKVVYGSVHPNMREALRTAAHLFAIGAIDPEFVTDDISMYNAKFTRGIFGACAVFRTCLDPADQDNVVKPFKQNVPDGEWIHAEVPRTDMYRDDINFRALSPRGWLRTGIYAKSKEIDACLRVLDYMNTDEGIMYNQYGVEGEHYEIKDGVVKKLIDPEKNKELGIYNVRLASEFLGLDWSPELQEVTAFGAARATFNKIDGILVDEANLYGKDLQEYCDSMIVKIIFGDIPVDEGFDEMVSGFYRRGGQELTDAYNKEIADRNG
jgi:ABC-type glycerol-3-phosphate transport system substrate-binding protein